MAATAAVAQGEDARSIRWGGDLRLRGEALNNARDLSDPVADSTAFYDDSYQYYRMRYRLWIEARPSNSLTIYLRAGNEYRWGVYEKGTSADGRVLEAASIRDPESRISLDNGWAELTSPHGLSLRFGRMDLAYGEGFLIFDGTPADGSSSVWFDAIKANWSGRGVSVDLFTAKIQDEGFGTPARDEDLYGLAARWRGLELYTLDKVKRSATVAGSGIVHPRQSTVALGGRYSHLPETGWQLSTEGAFQTGTYNDREGDLGGRIGDRNRARSGLGGYLRGGWVSSGTARAGVELGGVYLSGDDRSTGRYEGWDPFYGEWPKYSELLIYTLLDATTRVGINGSRPASVDDAGSWTNLRAAWIEGRVRAHPRARILGRFAWFGAAESGALASACGCPKAASKDRGILFAAQADLDLAAGVTGQVLGERFLPGDYYGRGEDPAWYGRAQIVARF